MGQPTGNFFSLKLSYSPLWFFILFLTADALLVFAPVPLAVDLTILLFGLLVPFVIALFLIKKPISAPKNSYFQTEGFEINAWFWILFALLFLITRFYKLTSLPWPVGADGYIAYYAHRLAAQGDWRVLYGNARVEPFIIWGLAAWFKCFQSTLAALKTFPVFIYGGVLAAGYFAARRFFSKTISFMALWFLAFNFLAIFINRQCQAAISLLLLECLCFYFLGGFLSASKGNTKFLWLLALGIGVGFYTYTPWPVVAVMAALPVILKTRYELPSSVKKLIGFLLVPLVLILPLIQARFSAGGVTYIQSLLSRPAALDYVEALFWNGLDITRYDPSRMGWFNPCFASLFLIGILELWRFRSFRMSQWLLGAFLLFLLPGALTNFFEIFRIIQILPLACVLATLGVHALLSSFRLANRKSVLVFCLLAVFSLGMDVYHYAGPGQLHDWNFWISNKRHFDSVDFSRAYPLLETAHRNGTSLLILSDLNNNNFDQTLNVTASPFDNAGSGQPPAEAALLVNCNYEPFLKQEFPDSQWTWLSPDLPSDYGGYALGFIPINPTTAPLLERWKKADAVLKHNNDLSMEAVSDTSTATLKDLTANYAVFQGDRFLESVFWDKVAFYEELQSNIPGAVAALKNGAQDGYPSAQFFNELGDLSAFFGKKDEAEVYFKKAIGCPVNRTTAVEKLRHLKAI